MASAPNDIIFYHYPASPFAKRIADYLALRRLKHAECRQPWMLPRPSLSSELNIHYRRIPLLALGNHVYADTRLILSKLESHFPDGPLTPRTSDQHGLARLLSHFTIDAGIFARATELFPSDWPALKDPKFVKDRQGLMPGRKWSPEDQQKRRPEALAHMRQCFEEFEHGLLADGRDWILKTEAPSLGDVEAVWPFVLLISMKGALEPRLFGAEKYPRVYAWVERYKAAVREGRKELGKPVSLEGAQAAKVILSSPTPNRAEMVDPNDPLGLKEGDLVAVFPTDYGFSHQDVGKLRRLDGEEVAIEIETKNKGKTLWLHFPRWGFRIKPVGDSKL